MGERNIYDRPPPLFCEASSSSYSTPDAPPNAVHDPARIVCPRNGSRCKRPKGGAAEEEEEEESETETTRKMESECRCKSAPTPLLPHFAVGERKFHAIKKVLHFLLSPPSPPPVISRHFSPPSLFPLLSRVACRRLVVVFVGRDYS